MAIRWATNACCRQLWPRLPLPPFHFEFLSISFSTKRNRIKNPTKLWIIVHTMCRAHSVDCRPRWTMLIMHNEAANLFPFPFVEHRVSSIIPLIGRLVGRTPHTDFDILNCTIDVDTLTWVAFCRFDGKILSNIQHLALDVSERSQQTHTHTPAQTLRMHSIAFRGLLISC